jgi:hypothetical protein
MERRSNERNMTSQEPFSRYAIQSRVRVRSSLRGAAGALVVVGIFLALGWSLKVPLGIMGFFLVVAGIELLNARSNERKVRNARNRQESNGERSGPGEDR